jgi:hypothetical protein
MIAATANDIALMQAAIAKFAPKNLILSTKLTSFLIEIYGNSIYCFTAFSLIFNEASIEKFAV